ncbi:Tripartite-type tricarboxylate transporter, receptor component TctC [Noviherbaspirillum humi]|uniref:Tripartite-type tricarboxylate transporter, receptor component TctC n=1 Tax=Noviherbaspirillum humi TaxID=1688639 RepID=A0A239G8B9_9BURK|nr:tripartite tricarboxylate transporter substrate binding protein [Noviherbaspirillum humi]SNS64703.1 Tripartite-type tricarboxylate transporter, receptor component TctC [Noviherbaspirillum humi]
MNDNFQKPASRRRFLLAMAACAAPGAVLAQANGNANANVGGTLAGPVRMLVPFTPGTTPDNVARLIGPRLARRLGQPVVVDNRPGASGIIGMEATAKAPPDGQTVMVTTNTTLTLPYFYKKVPFDVIQSFQPLAMIGSNNFALVAHPSLPTGSLQELVGYLKAHPGEVNYASPGMGTLHHLAMEKIIASTGVKMSHVPYKGTAGAMTDLIGGHVKLMIMPLQLAMPQQIEGKLKIIGATRAQPDPLYPKVVPLQEAGVPNFDEDAWVAVWGPKGMAPAMVALYNAAIREALEDPEVKAGMVQQGLTLRPSTPEELRRTAVAEYEKWGRVVREAKIQAE